MSAGNAPKVSDVLDVASRPWLYVTGYRPAYLPKRYEAIPMSVEGRGQAGEVMCARGVPEDWGMPLEAVGYFDEDGDGSLKAMVADYPNGRRAEYRRNSGSSRMTFLRWGPRS